MIQSGERFGSYRYKLMREIHQTLRDCRTEGSGSSLEAAVAMPPREQEEWVEAFREEFDEDEVATIPLDTAMQPPEGADPEDVEASWTLASQAASSSSAAASSERSLLEERPPERSALKQMTELLGSAVTAGNETRKPPRWDPQGKPVLDEQNRECSHYRRRSPALNSVVWSEHMSTAIGSSFASYSEAETVLRNWMARRPRLLESFRNLEQLPYPWTAGPGETEDLLTNTHSWGIYYYCELKEWLPKPRSDIDVVRGHSSQYNEALENVIHASSMYSVHRTILKGLQPGPLPGKGGMHGVYCYRRCGMSAALKSSGYAVYSWIGGSFLASPRYEVAAEIYRAGETAVGKIAAGDGQLCLKPGMYFVRGVWFHLLTKKDVARGPPTWVSWDDWIPEHELPVSSTSAA